MSKRWSLELEHINAINKPDYMEIITIGTNKVKLNYNQAVDLRNWISNWINGYRRDHDLSVTSQSKNVTNPETK